MENKHNISKFNRKRNILLALPMVALPVLATIFWALGGGTSAASAMPSKISDSPLLSVPTSQLQGQWVMTKSGRIPENSERDRSMGGRWSQFMEEWDEDLEEDLNEEAPLEMDLTPSPRLLEDSIEKANDLQASDQPMQFAGMDGTQEGFFGGQISSTLEPVSSRNQPASNNPERLGFQGDQELRDIDNMLDKILKIQNPSLMEAAETVTDFGAAKQVYTLGKTTQGLKATLLGNLSDALNSDGFHSEDYQIQTIASSNTVSAVVSQTQTVFNGSTVKLRLLEDLPLGDLVIPAGDFVFGTASINGERVDIVVGQVKFGSSIYKVNLRAHDMDGLTGIYVPGIITSETINHSANQSVQSVNAGLYDQSLLVQTANAGLLAAKSLFSRKIKLIKVTLKADYKLLLKSADHV